MPNRFIKECCRSSPTLQKLSNFQERLFWRLLTVADDYGRFEADPQVVMNTCFPLGCKNPLADVSRCFQILADSNTLILYENSGRRYGEFINFIAYQGEPRAKKSKHPAPPQPVDCEQMQTSASICTHMHPSSDFRVNLPSESSDPPLPPKGKVQVTVEELQTMIDAIPGIKKTKVLAGACLAAVKARLSEHPDRAFWDAYCRQVAASDFLCGRSSDFHACLSWLCGPKNMSKVLAGNYDQAEKPKLKRKFVL